MKKKHIENYLENRGMNPKQKLERDRGGQFLINFLTEFSQHVREETINEAVGTVRKMRLNVEECEHEPSRYTHKYASCKKCGVVLQMKK